MSGLRVSGVTIPPLTGVQLELGAGEIGQLQGPNGSGKSRVLALAAGLLIPANGETAWGEESPRPGRVALLFQNPDYQLLGRTVGEELDLIAKTPLAGEEALAVVGCTDLRDQAPESLSPGLRRRIALAGVLAGGAPLVLLDNPLADCDEAEGQALWQAVTELLHRQGRTLLVAGRLPAGARVDRTWDVQRWQP